MKPQEVSVANDTTIQVRENAGCADGKLFHNVIVQGERAKPKQVSKNRAVPVRQSRQARANLTGSDLSSLKEFYQARDHMSRNDTIVSTARLRIQAETDMHSSARQKHLELMNKIKEDTTSSILKLQVH